VKAEGRLDLVVCNASPPILPMTFDEHTAVRLNQYVAVSLALVDVPLAAALDVLAAHRGTAVIVSSVFAATDRPQLARARATYPHYVSAKAAIEGLAHAAAAARRDIGVLIVRPPRLEAELRLPVGDGPALPAASVAGALAERLMAGVAPGAAVVFEDFAQAPA
jgi:NAD(P)-dependent dehydrogenase (short-subunit alcohol dehydrogenase family)